MAEKRGAEDEPEDLPLCVRTSCWRTGNTELQPGAATVWLDKDACGELQRKCGGFGGWVGSEGRAEAEAGWGVV